MNQHIFELHADKYKIDFERNSNWMTIRKLDRKTNKYIFLFSISLRELLEFAEQKQKSNNKEYKRLSSF